MDIKGMVLDVEINENKEQYVETYKQVNKIFNSVYGGRIHVMNNSNSNTAINIKGQIKFDLSDGEILNKIPKNVMLLGRYAEWNKRITWDRVIQRLYDNKKWLQTFVY